MASSQDAVAFVFLSEFLKQRRLPSDAIDLFHCFLRFLERRYRSRLSDITFGLPLGLIADSKN